MAIALQEWIAYYPPLCGGSNGEREGILSVMVMMHFKWAVNIIHQPMIMAGESTLCGHDANEMVKKGLCRVHSVCHHDFTAMDDLRGAPGFFS